MTSWCTTPGAPARMSESSRGRALLGLVLAAGSGTRLGRGAKALLAVGPSGTTLVEHAVTVLNQVCSGTVVVVGASGSTVRDTLERSGLPDRGMRVVQNPDWESGMAGSLQTGLVGVEALAKAQELGTGIDVMVTVVDQPGISGELLKHLVAARADPEAPPPDEWVTVADYGSNRPRHPMIFPVNILRTAAARATGDSGARQWLREHPHRVNGVDCSHLDDGADLDTPADLERWMCSGQARGEPPRSSGCGNRL